MGQNEKEILSLKRMAADNYYNYALRTLVSVLGFELVKDHYELEKYLRFEKQAEGSIHKVLLEDHREDEDIKDWLIFSELKDDETDWFGKKIDSPYPLTLSELKAFETFIKAFQNYKEAMHEF